jgi:hypothetical protein
MTVTPRDGSCFIDRLARPEPEWVLFTCDGVSDKITGVKLRIDPWDPQGRSRWSGMVRSMVPQTECTAYGVDARGNRICLSTRTLNVEKESVVGGSMVLKPLVRG